MRCRVFLLLTCGLLTASAGWGQEPPTAVRTYLTDLPPEVIATVEALPAEALDRTNGYAVLARAFEESKPYLFEQGALVAYTDPRWYSTLPGSDGQRPILELRRWPGDTVLDLHAVAVTEAPETPPVPDTRFKEPRELGQGVIAWYGTWSSQAGERPVIWLERDLGAGQPRLGGLLVPGDGGLGPGALSSIVEELQAVFLRVETLERFWPKQPTLDRSKSVAMPELGEPPGERREQDHPWQVAVASDFTLGLPPGFRARRTDGSVPPPRPIPGSRLWLRGRYIDIEGKPVVVGDQRRAGYVARIDEPDRAWRSGKTAPLGAPDAKQVVSQPYDLIEERTDAKDARAERWREPDFPGSWLLFRLTFADVGYEIALPVVKGRRSESLFWVPVSWRAAGETPAPPPIDPAMRFGIAFERLSRSEQKQVPWTEGYLDVPGLRVALPQEWWPSATLRAVDGYPIRIMHRDGTQLGRLERLSADESAELAGWAEQERPARFRAQAWYRREDGSAAFVAPDGSAFRFVVDELAQERVTWWQRMLEAVQLKKAEP